jgi:phosphotriesterase-related protein
MPHADRGKIVTVQGPIAPSDLGTTLMHEHLKIDFLAVPAEQQPSHSLAYDPATFGARWHEPLTPANAYEARRNSYSLKATLQMVDEDDAVRAMEEYRSHGGRSLVELTPIGVGRDPALLRRVSERTGVHVVMGTGYYVNDLHPPGLAQRSEAEIADAILADIHEGTGTPAVRPGIIGEIGLVWPVHPVEARVLRAAARCQRLTGLLLTIHPGRNPEAPMDAIRIVEEAGGDPTRTIICHLDRTIFTDQAFLDLARTGCYLEQDLFGLESSYYPLAEIDMPNDAMRIDRILMLMEKGYLDRVLISEDIDNISRHTTYGGEGYHHILTRVVPVMRRKGMSQAEIDRILIGNPARALTIV